MKTVHDFKVKTIEGNEKSLQDYAGKTMLIVNTASKCGLAPQFEALQALYEKYKDQGLEILSFPSSQFMEQEFDNIEETMDFCQTNYNVSFPMFAKIDVNGETAHPLYQHLKSEKGGVLSDEIKWNFTKFLINPDGQVEKRYAPTTKPNKIEGDIVQTLV